jgi:hypothetical protein
VVVVAGEQAVLHERSHVDEEGDPVAYEQFPLLGELLVVAGRPALEGPSCGVGDAFPAQCRFLVRILIGVPVKS